MMAWIGIATSLTFGFNIYKFSQLDGLGWAQQVRLIGTRAFALMLMGIGLISLLLATINTARISGRSVHNVLSSATQCFPKTSSR